jgi:hypothetical protein
VHYALWATFDEAQLLAGCPWAGRPPVKAGEPCSMLATVADSGVLAAQKGGERVGEHNDEVGDNFGGWGRRELTGAATHGGALLPKGNTGEWFCRRLLVQLVGSASTAGQRRSLWRWQMVQSAAGGGRRRRRAHGHSSGFGSSPWHHC